MAKDAALRAGREAIGIWPLMLWAYGTEMVRATCGTDFKPAGWTASDHSSLAWAISAAQSGALLGGDGASSWAPACCHDDALAVHGAVLKVIVAIDHGLEDSPARREAFQLLIKHAELGQAPTWDLPAPMWRCVPKRRPNGKVRHLFNTRKVAYACEVDVIGEIAGVGMVVRSPAEYQVIRAEARRRYAQWVALLDQVIHTLLPYHGALTRWRLTGLGVEAEPWRGEATRAA